MGTGTYTTTTLGDALGELGRRLYDPIHIRWTETELTFYVREALRTYNAFTNHYRDSVEFDAVNKQAFYELATVAPGFRAMTVTVREVVDQILYMLLEPPLNGTMWMGTSQYTLDDILGAIQQSRDTFRLETGVIVTNGVTLVDTPPTDGIIELDEDVLNVRRAAWETETTIVSPLRREDQWGLVNYRVGWQTPRAAVPLAYSVSAQPPLQLQLAPVTFSPGNLHLLTVERGEVPDLLDAQQSLGIPDDWAWVVTFGALTQLFQRDGIALDNPRANYCNSRWTDGLARARAAAVVISAQVNGTWTPLGDVLGADAFSSDWQTMSGIPKRVLTIGQTLIGLWPPAGVRPAGGTYTVNLDVVRNAPVPVNLGDYLQVGPDTLNDLLDYAQHLALIKEGPGQVEGAMGLLNQFADLCNTTVAVQMASNPNDPSLLAQTTQDRRQLAYRAPD